MRLPAVTLALALVVVGQTASAAPASEIDAAKDLGTEGLKLYDAQKYEQALAKFDEADAHARVPTLDLFAARCLDRLHRLRDAKTRYEEVIRAVLPVGSSQKWIEAQAEAKTELAALEARIPSITVHPVGAGERKVTLSIDAHDEPILDVPREVEAGPHSVVLVVGGKQYKRDVDLNEGDHPTIEIAVDAEDKKPIPPPVPENKGPSGVVVAGAVTLSLGAAALVAWGATGGAALAKASSEHCNGSSCPASVGTLHTLRIASTGAFYAGVPLTLLGGTLLVVSAATSHGTKASLRASLSDISVDVHF